MNSIKKEIFIYDSCSCGQLKLSHYINCNKCFLDKKSSTKCSCGYDKDKDENYCYYCYKDICNEFIEFNKSL
jgi:hypothetical protein